MCKWVKSRTLGSEALERPLPGSAGLFIWTGLDKAMALDVCPACDRPLGPPLKASGRQVCARCGWSDRPRQPQITTDDSGLPIVDILQLLRQAEAEALNNMKPKRAQKPLQPPEHSE